MKRVGILTINDYTNYGNRLQNYAVQEVLKAIGIEPCTVVNTTIKKQVNNGLRKSKLSRILAILGDGFSDKVKAKMYHELNKEQIGGAKELKVKNLKAFTEKYIKETDYSISVNSVPENVKDEFDYFVTGSDQVWNPSFRRFSEIDFLTFVPREKRIAFSPSFGISQIPNDQKEYFKEWILGMKDLSVREDAGADIIKRLTGRDSKVLLDPTMTLDKEKWLKICSESIHKPKKKYLCTYFLGQTYNVHKKDIKKIARDNNLELVNLGSIYDLDRYSIDPSEFLDFINSSELFLTDSFHGGIFSILFNKPFIVFDRLGSLPAMNSRLDTLLSKFKFEDRKWENIKDVQNFFDIEFTHVPEILESEKRKTLDYLKEALNIKDGK